MTEYRTIESTDPDRPYDFSDQYELLVGPEFKCLITEPEDRTFYRDLSCVIERLNAQHELIAELYSVLHYVKAFSVPNTLFHNKLNELLERRPAFSR